MVYVDYFFSIEDTGSIAFDRELKVNAFPPGTQDGDKFTFRIIDDNIFLIKDNK